MTIKFPEIEEIKILTQAGNKSIVFIYNKTIFIEFTLGYKSSMNAINLCVVYTHVYDMYC